MNAGTRRPPRRQLRSVSRGNDALAFPVGHEAAVRLADLQRDESLAHSISNILAPTNSTLHGERGRTVRLLATLAHERKLSWRTARRVLVAHSTFEWDRGDPNAIADALEALAYERVRLRDTEAA